MLRTRISSSYTKDPPTQQDPFSHKRYSLKCSSVLLDKDALFDLDSGKIGDDVERKTLLYVAFPHFQDFNTASVNFTSHLKHEKPSSSSEFRNASLFKYK